MFYRTIDLPELYVLYKTGHIWPTRFSSNQDSQAPDGVWSFWFEERMVAGNFGGGAIVTCNNAVMNKSIMTATQYTEMGMGSMYGPNTQDERLWRIREYYTDEIITPCTIEVGTWKSLCIDEGWGLTPHALQEDFFPNHEMSFEGDLWDDIQGFIDWIEFQDRVNILAVPSFMDVYCPACTEMVDHDTGRTEVYGSRDAMSLKREE